MKCFFNMNLMLNHSKNSGIGSDLELYDDFVVGSGVGDDLGVDSGVGDDLGVDSGVGDELGVDSGVDGLLLLADY
ncbi:hypothetical protein PCHDS_000536900 [Plasmodium chabaudi adami]|uniref:Uncharacterized protein n=1 Tax=Plasmodium chabaudi adami TaxID=5826 RepID=A0A1C6WPU9_PLACE|nr:hypothetical protein PCHDS_000536900 [Plasmodium chabaudi adami]